MALFWIDYLMFYAKASASSDGWWPKRKRLAPRIVYSKCSLGEHIVEYNIFARGGGGPEYAPRIPVRLTIPLLARRRHLLCVMWRPAWLSCSYIRHKINKN